MIPVGSWVQGDDISGLVTGRAFNGVCVMLRVQTDFDKVRLIPEPRVQAPSRSSPRLAVDNTGRV